MKIAATVARLLLGLVFVAAGLSGFILIGNPPPAPPGLASEFQHVFFASRWVLVVDGVQLVAGLLLLVDRFVPLALTLLGAVIVNILTFHATMMAPSTLAVPLVVVALWTVLVYRHRASLAPLFTARDDVVRAAFRSDPG